jgi:myosin heavy subunit
VAGVLHCGNVKFKVKKIDNAEDGSEVQNPDVLAHAASLWGVDAAELEKYLTNRYIYSYTHNTPTTQRQPHTTYSTPTTKP